MEVEMGPNAGYILIVPPTSAGRVGAMTERGRPGRCNVILAKEQIRSETGTIGIVGWGWSSLPAFVMCDPGKWWIL